MFRNRSALALLVVSLFVGPSLADDVTGAKRLLCSPFDVHECSVGANCEQGEPWELDLPPFVEIDLEGKQFRSTPSSGKQRTTPIRTVEHDGQIIVLQGYEQGRAFSGIISETSGVITLSVTLDDRVVVIYGACTPR